MINFDIIYCFFEVVSAPTNTRDSLKANKIEKKILENYFDNNC
jgi:hypothetical protein